MNAIHFDFATIDDVEDFYRQFAHKFGIERGFGHNLDALWDALTGMIALPARVTLRHLELHRHPRQFDNIIAVFREAEESTKGKFRLRVR